MDRTPFRRLPTLAALCSSSFVGHREVGDSLVKGSSKAPATLAAVVLGGSQADVARAGRGPPTGYQVLRGAGAGLGSRLGAQFAVRTAGLVIDQPLGPRGKPACPSVDAVCLEGAAGCCVNG